MRDDTKEKLELIVEKANKLKVFGFEKHVREVGLGIKGTRQDDGTWVYEFGIPDEKERDAFLLTFRLFYQENELISFTKLPHIFTDPSLSQIFIEEVTKIRRGYTIFLKRFSDVTVDLFEGHPNNKEIIDVCLYGGLAHSNNKDFVLRFRKWTHDEFNEYLLMQTFTACLIVILDLIYKLADNCELELSRHFPDLK